MRIRALAAAIAVLATVGGAPGAARANTSVTVPTTTVPTTTAPATTAPATTTPTSTAPAATTPTSTVPATTPAPTPAPPATATAKLSESHLFTVAGAPYRVTVAGAKVVLSGVISPWIHAQSYVLDEFLGSRLVHRYTVALHGSSTGRTASFTLAVPAPGVGNVALRLVHAASPQLQAFSAETHFTALSEAVGVGSRGPFVTLVQQRLAALHFYIPLTGVLDNGTELALDAYHRVLGQGEGDESLNPATVADLLNGTGTFHIRYRSQGRHAEGDLSDQVLALADGSKVDLLFPISSGKPSTPTVLGSWQVYERVPGYLPDGMYYSDFFIRGYAIHGYDPAPDYPASHGCMRLPIPDAITAFDWLAIGDWVDSYYT